MALDISWVIPCSWGGAHLPLAHRCSMERKAQVLLAYTEGHGGWCSRMQSRTTPSWMLCKGNLTTYLHLLIRTNQERYRFKATKLSLVLFHHSGCNKLSVRYHNRALQLELSDIGFNPNTGANEEPWVSPLLSLNLNFCHFYLHIILKYRKWHLGEAENKSISHGIPLLTSSPFPKLLHNGKLSWTKIMVSKSQQQKLETQHQGSESYNSWTLNRTAASVYTYRISKPPNPRKGFHSGHWSYLK